MRGSVVRVPLGGVLAPAWIGSSSHTAVKEGDETAASGEAAGTLLFLFCLLSADGEEGVVCCCRLVHTD